MLLNQRGCFLSNHAQTTVFCCRVYCMLCTTMHSLYLALTLLSEGPIFSTRAVQYIPDGFMPVLCIEKVCSKALPN